MIKIRLFCQNFKFTTALLLLFTLSAPHSAFSAPNIPTSIQFNPPAPPAPDPSEPGGRPEGGGNRGDCRSYEAITPIVPTVKMANQTDVRWGLTTSDRPTVWFYAPNGLEAGVPLEWTLRDRTGNRIYRMKVKSVQSAPGVIHLTPSEAAPQLAVNQSYRWALSIYCSKNEPDTPLILRGGLKRVDLSPEVARQIATEKTPVARAGLYANNGIWYDAVTALGMPLKSQQDSSITAAWADLLRQAGLSNAAAAPVSSCCTLKSSK